MDWHDIARSGTQKSSQARVHVHVGSRPYMYIPAVSGVPRIRGLKPLPLAYDFRNKRVRKRQNTVFSRKKIQKKILGRAGGTAASPDPSPVGWGIPSPLPLGAYGTSTPPILKFWARQWLQSVWVAVQRSVSLLQRMRTWNTFTHGDVVPSTYLRSDHKNMQDLHNCCSPH